MSTEGRAKKSISIVPLTFGVLLIVGAGAMIYEVIFSGQDATGLAYFGIPALLIGLMLCAFSLIFRSASGPLSTQQATGIRVPIRVRIASLLCWACGFVVASVAFRDDFILLLNSATIAYSVVAVLFLVAGHILWSARRIGVIIAGVSLAALVIAFALAKTIAAGMPAIGIIPAPLVEVVLASGAIILAATAWKGLRTGKSEASPN